MWNWGDQFGCAAMIQMWDKKFGSGVGMESFEMDQDMVQKEELTETTERLGTWSGRYEKAKADTKLAVVRILLSLID